MMSLFPNQTHIAPYSEFILKYYCIPYLICKANYEILRKDNAQFLRLLWPNRYIKRIPLYSQPILMLCVSSVSNIDVDVPLH